MRQIGQSFWGSNQKAIRAASWHTRHRHTQRRGNTHIPIHAHTHSHTLHTHASHTLSRLHGKSGWTSVRNEQKLSAKLLKESQWQAEPGLTHSPSPTLLLAALDDPHAPARTRTKTLWQAGRQSWKWSTKCAKLQTKRRKCRPWAWLRFHK